MSPCYIGEGIAICTGTNTRYYARTRRRGYRRYKVVSKHRSYRAAVLAMAKAFASDRNLKRADVLRMQDWYDPDMLCELVQA